MTIKDRFPSKRDIFNVLAAIAFPVFAWSLIHTFFEIPAWKIRMDTWDLIGTIAYTQTFALFESIIILLLFIILGVLLPKRLFRDKFVALSTAVIFITTLWFILAHYYDEIIRAWGGKQLLFFISLFGLTILSVSILIFRSKILEKIIIKINNRLGILSSIYIFIGIISVFVVILRNLI